MKLRILWIFNLIFFFLRWRRKVYIFAKGSIIWFLLQNPNRTQYLSELCISPQSSIPYLDYFRWIYTIYSQFPTRLRFKNKHPYFLFKQNHFEETRKILENSNYFGKIPSYIFLNEIIKNCNNLIMPHLIFYNFQKRKELRVLGLDVLVNMSR